ncbi:hypothetical protein [Halococcus sediminicola]|uniref:hypothetical protein n=1 Tax=Halococcus sediminicola TaxID=1264579 RepID=UPI0006788C04|nr:hypothetical protein [Halococcus sediminicola]
MTEDTVFDGSANAQNQTPQGGQSQSGSDSEVAARYKANPLTLTVFKRKVDDNTFHNCQIQRAYTPDDGDTWKYTDSLRPQDLRKAARLMEKAADDFDQVRVETPDQG